jgi:A/G-specific adenine glycosylase
MRRLKPYRSTCVDHALDQLNSKTRTASKVRDTRLSPRVSLSSSAKRKLLDWFDRHARPLPWRQDRDPYRIWLSEVMLQQTTVAVVVPRFERFLTRFPSINALAAADEQELLREWEGLGYYHRARNLRAAARILAGEHGGSIPDDPEVVAQLPGVGRYILGAVLSQAFDRRLPIVEANTTRVLCRLFGQTGDPKSAPVREWLWETALAVLPKTRIGDFNQALMELGATVCTPKSPGCVQCPLRATCAACMRGDPASIPRMAAKPTVVDVREACVVFRRAGRVLLARRPPTGRWPNMWEFPRVVLKGKESHQSGLRRLIASLGLTAESKKRLMTIRYGVTRFRMSMVCLEARASAADFQSDYYEEGRWVRPADLSDYPVSSPQRKLAAVIQAPTPARPPKKA